jgi:hypothetical protein
VFRIPDIDIDINIKDPTTVSRLEYLREFFPRQSG